jgi:hypothetical protein
MANKVGGFGLEGDQKQAYAMALMALGKGIADGDVAGGFKDAGLAANAIMEQGRDRRDKAEERKIQESFYKDKLKDAIDIREERLITAAIASSLKAYNDWLQTTEGIAAKSIEGFDFEQKKDDFFQADLKRRKEARSLGDTISTGENLEKSSLNTQFSFGDLDRGA